jgi:hypothetical protein
MNTARLSSGKAGLPPLDYFIEGREIEDRGISTPINLYFNLSNMDDSPSSLFFNDASYNVKYVGYRRSLLKYDAFKTMKFDKYSSMIDACVGSSSVPSVAASDDMVKVTINDQLNIFNNITDYISDNLLCPVFDINCDIPSLMASLYGKLSPILSETDEGGVELYCNPGNNGMCTKWGDDMSVDEIYSELKKNTRVSLMDGLYHGDDSSIFATLSNLQRTHEDVDRFKVVTFATAGGGIGDVDMSNNVRSNPADMFGKYAGCVTGKKGTSNLESSFGLAGLEYLATKKQIFRGEDCEKARVIYKGRFDDPYSWSDKQNCGSFDENCTTIVSVIAWKGISTISNPEQGIKEGSLVDLFFVQIIVDPSVSIILPSAGELKQEAGEQYFVKSLDRLAQEVHEILKRLPTDVHNVVFGDAKYCPADFPNISSYEVPVNYYTTK